jgi:hypothetical protein
VDKEIIRISIGCVAVAFRVPNKRIRNALQERYSGFFSKNASRISIIDCLFSRKKLSTAQQVMLNSPGTGTWRAVRYDFKCVWGGPGGTAVLWPSLYSFDALLRVIVATSLLSRGGVLIHASAVVYNNAAYVFAGPSGSGKTTIARFSQCRKILNDEIVALSVNKSGEVAATGTPFWGEMGSGPAHNRRFSLHSLFFLKKSRFQHSEPLTISKAIGKLLRCVCVFGDSKEESNLALGICAQILSGANYSILHFPKKPLEWKLIESSL